MHKLYIVNHSEYYKQRYVLMSKRTNIVNYSEY